MGHQKKRSGYGPCDKNQEGQIQSQEASPKEKGEKEKKVDVLFI